jgi:hypothetical protein
MNTSQLAVVIVMKPTIGELHTTNYIKPICSISAKDTGSILMQYDWGDNAHIFVGAAIILKQKELCGEENR